MGVDTCIACRACKVLIFPKQRRKISLTKYIEINGNLWDQV
jgi:uncharacterized protein YxjI